MRKQLKGIVTLGLIACLSVSSSMTALANGHWEKQSDGTWKHWYSSEDLDEDSGFYSV